MNVQVKSTNPFDNDDAAGVGTSNNETNRGNNPASSSDDDDNHLSEDEMMPSEETASSSSSWQYLKDLPYRQVPIYTNVHWETTTPKVQHGDEGDHGPATTSDWFSPGLEHYPIHGSSGAVSSSTSSSSMMMMMPPTTPQSSLKLQRASTITRVVGCPLGGPLCRVTSPLVPSAKFRQTHLLVSTNAGKLLHTINFPPRIIDNDYTAASILALGFTSRQILVVILNDSLCLCYNLKPNYKTKNENDDSGTANLVLDPFFALGTPQRLATAAVYNGGLVCLAQASPQNSALVELWDSHDDVHLIPRPPGSYLVEQSSSSTTSSSGNTSNNNNNHSSDVFAVVTPLDTASFCQAHDNLQLLSLAVLPRHCTSHGHVEIYMSTLDASVIVVNPSLLLSTTTTGTKHASSILDLDCRAQFRMHGNITHLRFAPNGRFLACFTTKGMLSVVSSNFDTHVVDFDTVSTNNSSNDALSAAAATAPLEMCWCGEDSVLLQWKSLGVLMVGPFADWLRFPYKNANNNSNSSNSVHLVPEVDGCRIVTSDSVEWLQRVPPVCVDILRMGSIHPGALLMDAASAFFQAKHHTNKNNNGSGSSIAMAISTSNRRYTKDASSLDRLQEQGGGASSSKNGLVTAVRACLEAATQELDIVTQKRLLRAASFGLHHYLKSKNNNNNSGSGRGNCLIGGPVRRLSDQDDSDEDDEEDENEEPGEHNRRHYQNNAGYQDILPDRLTRKFVRSAQTLRILNAMRHPNVGLLTTMTQCQSVGLEGVVARLVDGGWAALATQVARYAGLSRSVQLYCRASQAAQYVEQMAAAAPTATALRDVSDSQLAQTAMNIIAGKALTNGNNNSSTTTNNSTNNGSGDDINPKGVAELQQSQDTSMFRGAYATVAQAATRAGRPGVANLLLLLETSVADKVPALVASGNFSDAVAVSTAKSDADFLLSTILNYEALLLSQTAAGEYGQAQAQFYTTVVTKFTPEAFYTLRKYLTVVGDRQRSVGLDLRGQMFALAGTDMALHALKETDPREIVGMLTEASRIFGLGNSTFHKACTDDYLSLRKDQDILRKKYNAEDIIPDSASSSVTRTIAAVIGFAANNQREQHRLLVDAEKIAKKFRVPEKRLWHIKVKAYADSGQWSNLRVLADSRKPPIGFRPFARAAINGGQSEAEILRYIDCITDPDERYDALCYGQLWSKALDEAFRLRDGQKIHSVKHLCNSSEIQRRADELLGKLT